MAASFSFALVAVLPLAMPAAAQLTLVPWQADRECRRLVIGMRRLPPDTPAPDWPMRVAIKGVTFPVWSSVKAAAHMNDALKVYWLSGRVDSTLIESQWPAAHQRIASEIASGEISLGFSTVYFGPRIGQVTFWRIRKKLTSAGDLSGEFHSRVKANEDFLIIHDSRNYKDVVDWPLQKGSDNSLPQVETPAILVLIDGRPRFVTFSGRVLSTLFLAGEQSGLLDKCSLNYKDHK
jgi:hypothetical protein